MIGQAASPLRRHRLNMKEGSHPYLLSHVLPQLFCANAVGAVITRLFSRPPNFRVFHEIQFFERETGPRADIAYMVDQSHNLEGKLKQ